MKQTAALYVHGKIVTGTHHGEAFEKLSDDEKEGDICSGFLNEGKFVSDEKEFYLKKIILVRHADADDSQDPGITNYGRSQIQRAAIFLNAFVNLADYQGFTSPIKRCRETAHEFHTEINLKFNVHDDLADIEDIARLKKLLETLPNKSFLISHCNFIRNMAKLATGINTEGLKVHNCCILFIDNGFLSKLGSIC